MNNLLIHDPDLLHVLIEEFFCLRKLEGKHPTVPGLVLAVGFNRTLDLSNVLEKWESGDSDYPDRSVNYLISSLTRIEDYFLQEGLSSKMPPALVKFALGSYHNVKEPTREDGGGSNNLLQIVFEAPEGSTAPNVSKLQSANTKPGLLTSPIEVEM